MVLQATLLRGKVDLLLWLTVWASKRGVFRGTLTGWCGGLFLGALRGDLALPMAFLYGLVGYLAGLLLAQKPRLVEVVGLVAGLTLVLTVGEGLLLMSLGLPPVASFGMVLVNVAVLTPLLLRP